MPQDDAAKAQIGLRLKQHTASPSASTRVQNGMTCIKPLAPVLWMAIYEIRFT
jgi:hypothetical protein